VTLSKNLQQVLLQFLPTVNLQVPLLGNLRHLLCLQVQTQVHLDGTFWGGVEGCVHSLY
jgi:hypothetical protein